ncbi:MAG: hypothetical protein ACFFD2_10075, partial [Promethearchaeota archaeon]
ASFSFKQGSIEKIDGLEKFIISGGLIGISQIISNLIDSKKHLKFVDHGDVKLLFEYGKFLTNVLIVDEKLEILHEKLKKFTKLIEDLYEDNLRSWDGNINHFNLLNSIVEANFRP